MISSQEGLYFIELITLLLPKCDNKPISKQYLGCKRRNRFHWRTRREMNWCATKEIRKLICTIK